MNVARRNVFSLLQKGAGSSSTRMGGAFSTKDFLGGFHVNNNDEQQNRSFSTKPRIIHGRYYKKIGAPGRKGEPTMEMAKTMPLNCKEMANSDLVMLGEMKSVSALKEILIRHIMSVDHCSYNDAEAVFQKIADKNREGMWLLTLPYKVGIVVAVTAAAGSFPMVFDIETVKWFNELYVTMDVPEPRDLETPLEVSTWSWNWMEPPLGQISFMLLCLQYIR